MNENYFKYEIKGNGWSRFVCRNLTWFEKFMYRLQGCKVIELTEDFWKNHRAENKKNTTYHIEIIY